MEAITSEAQTPYQLLGSQKLVHLVRHAQGLHNLEAEKGRDAQKRIEFIDPELSSNGWQQVVDQRKNVSASGMLGRIEVVITSPMLRTLQTAVGIFGGEDLSSSKETAHVEKINNHFSNSISIFNQRPPIIAHELCRERMIESEDDVSWETDAGETNDAVAVRGIEFIKWFVYRN
ncbi:Histidine phosphatase superfamily, clade-1 [Corchorus olitorius]|uniref:Histidine phosphatase superfamily, clade-1 n=1 Tax=Corchorus olitorius TaxID=93759 RepID=A0A1R3GJW7_9ROSI|nr:Histidine phosphatase superfamily, clade-1 [Corchorus olitorius]